MCKVFGRSVERKLQIRFRNSRSCFLVASGGHVGPGAPRWVIHRFKTRQKQMCRGKSRNTIVSARGRRRSRVEAKLPSMIQCSPATSFSTLGRHCSAGVAIQPAVK